MTLQEGCRLLENLELIPVTILDCPESIKSFCNKYRIHNSQTLFTKSVLSKIIEELKEDELILTIDDFKIKMLFALYGKTPIAYGPYCTELLSVDESAILLSHLKIKDFPPDLLAKLRGRYTVTAQQNVQYHINILLSHVSGNDLIHTVKTYNVGSASDDDTEEIIPSDYHIKVVREHYANEQLLIKSISDGDYASALNAWRILHKAVSYKNIGHTIELARLSAAVTRTLLRMGAINAGIPSEINDRISGNSSQLTAKARTIDAINMEHERLIKEYCDIITEYKKNQYSSNVLSVRFLIEKEYDRPLKLDEIADELSLSSSQLVHLFKKETGTTPMAYLHQIRIKKAAYELANTKNSIQDIAASVGILDSNYFVKCFKKEYEMTPSAYRKRFTNSISKI
ncbi:AraC family transcriptional regulator [Butyrivibrio fibrisolvens]|uniref:AraC family transcriptional regulator n=1 Tax=Butyrivibrio fibrisolvens TaxID=831 RepID=UPI0003B5A3D1|nr:AraC family transcriptional regulator [Butyrivibrio fibrisolvens]